MIETINTGVIYKITNTKNGKIYIGKAFSYVKNGKQKLRKHGSKDRLEWHLNKAFSKNKKLNEECPLLYEAMRKYGKDCWKTQTLLVCDKNDLKTNEELKTKEFNSHDSTIGYNFLIGDQKPTENSNKIVYEKKKVDSNRERAKNSAMKRTEINKTLPTNIYYRKSKLGKNEVEGYFVQIKINGKYKSKAFMSKKITMDEKLELAKEFLSKIKEEYL